VQDEAHRDAEAIRHLDTADRLAPTRIRNDPIARDLVITWTAALGAGSGSWTRCVTGSASGAPDLYGMSRPRSI
jgi:hypothetical protein